MKIISFDVGIKNMAYCIIHIENGGFSVMDWNILNLMDKESDTVTCNCTLEPTGSKKKRMEQTPKICGKKGKYIKEDKIYCEKHALKCSRLMYNKEYIPASLKKKKIPDLTNLCIQYSIPISNIASKQMILDTMNSYFETHMLNPIKEMKKKTASETDLIHIGRNMKRLLDDIPNIETLTHVIIENQISPIANRMKTIQGMLAQYFIMKGSPDIIIEFISSSNKLKGFTQIKTEEKKNGEKKNEKKNGEKKNGDGDVEKETPENLKTKYKQHKKDGITICSQFIENNVHMHGWKECMNSVKKDDLADCFLQGIWYLKHKNIINYAEDLKINSVLLS
jgi:hypothetical protein